MKGIHEFEFEGKTRGFLFNFVTLGILEERENTPIDDIIQRFSKGSKSPKLKLVLSFFHAAAINYADEKGRQIDFTLNDVSEWVQFIGFDKATGLMSNALKSTTPKNSKPLQTLEKEG